MAALPKPVDSVYGKYYAGDVFNGLTGSKKRKRPEIAVGIDGESVNIYAVRNLFGDLVHSIGQKLTSI